MVQVALKRAKLRKTNHRSQQTKDQQVFLCLRTQLFKKMACERDISKLQLATLQSTLHRDYFLREYVDKKSAFEGCLSVISTLCRLTGSIFSGFNPNDVRAMFYDKKTPKEEKTANIFADKALYKWVLNVFHKWK